MKHQITDSLSRRSSSTRGEPHDTLIQPVLWGVVHVPEPMKDNHNWQLWCDMWASVEDGDVDSTVDDVPVIIATYLALRRGGVVFDESFAFDMDAMIIVAHRQKPVWDDYCESDAVDLMPSGTWMF